MQCGCLLWKSCSRILRVLTLTPYLMASTMSTDRSDDVISVKLKGVKGDEEKVNDVFVYGQKTDCKEHIIYFGGDVQDYPEKMERSHDNKRYVMWNTESTAARIFRKFPASLVFVIRPTKMHLHTFAVYSNFLETNDFGSPTHSNNFGAIKHLSCLYPSILEKIYGKSHEEDSSVSCIRLIGFSKGCIVLNQVVFELHLLDQNKKLKSFMEKVKAFYWLDGGHSGGKDNTWVTDDNALRNLASLDCDIHIHVSPYQVKDPLRKWIGQQESKFYKKLQEASARVTEKVHFESEEASLEHHFHILEDF